MHPTVFAKSAPDRLAYVMAGTGQAVTYRELDERSNQGAQLFRALGLRPGDGVAIMMENHPIYYEVLWAAQRAGLRYTAVSSRLTAGEVEYIVSDSGAKAFIASQAMADVALEVAARSQGVQLLMVDAALDPFASFEAERAKHPITPIPDETPGGPMLYSSGTTGRPKGVMRELSGGPLLAGADALTQWARTLYGMDEETIYLSPAPLYHAAPLGWSMNVHRLGGTVILMEKFDAEQCLALIERHKVTHAQFVPTHFVRMLKLPEEVRAKYDHASLKVAFHAAAPCPVPVKEQMIAWWGPIIHEYYAGTEGNGRTTINSEEWLAHKGSVGRATPPVEVKICDEDGEPLPPRTEGLVYFAGGGKFSYHNAPAKVAESTNKYGWTTLGDVGWLDEEGFLYLTDRKSFMIISGGVNIYPQEIENLLITHPRVADAAVVGAPDEEMGERVVAVIQPLDWADASEDLRAELTAFCRANLSSVKLPRQIDFMDELPRHPTGKLYKRLIRDAYWAKAQPQAV
ncbi:MAG: acyl-CoA synthetase [Phenylobacterium sp.]|jgi:long-chain acyl-CoA synthetase|uniref:acyl-CoA synthetase n=1 Tax=Phenylobacterium sp. TaxID=1871053 RepID=UPI002A33A7ED|nr:acyl-CoA synthetase [Phenylobacterium sp.]MDD3837751.1 acyl-CoA synthetase [Phenylobacterium sp.]MDX9996427.1 acyl-CoA synthetase [Phenylobacterium sp.]